MGYPGSKLANIFSFANYNNTSLPFSYLIHSLAERSPRRIVVGNQVKPVAIGGHQRRHHLGTTKRQHLGDHVLGTAGFQPLQSILRRSSISRLHTHNGATGFAESQDGFLLFLLAANSNKTIQRLDNGGSEGFTPRGGGLGTRLIGKQGQ